MELLAGNHAILKPGPAIVGTVLFRSVAPILIIAIVIVPVVTLVANLFDRRGSFSVVLQQEYGSLCSVCLYVYGGVFLISLLCAVFVHFSGIQAAYVASVMQSQNTEQMRSMIQLFALSPEQLAILKAQLNDPVYISTNLFMTFRLPLIVVGYVAAVRVLFRVSILRAMAILALAGIISLRLPPIFIPANFAPNNLITIP